jgi:hypothetical protein
MMWSGFKGRLPVGLKHRLKAFAAPPLSFGTAALINSKGKHRVQVVAMRRSGHHAIVNWLISAYESSAVEWSPNARRTFISATGHTAFINDLTGSRRNLVHYEIMQRAAAVRSSQRLIVNLEDISIAQLSQQAFALRSPDVKLYVRRPLLDLAASRLKAHRTWGEGSEENAPVNRWLLDTLLVNESLLNDWLVIDYDRWLTNSDGHRREVLSTLGLSADHMPSVSPFGGGSSFTGVDRVPTPRELTSRYRQVDWPAETVELLLEPQYRSLLRPADVEFLNGLQQS